jgi:hypothetical protein
MEHCNRAGVPEYPALRQALDVVCKLYRDNLMFETIPQKPKEFVKDLSEFDTSQTSLHMSVSAKNIDKLKHLRIENLWLTGAKEKDLEKILSLTQPRYLNLYQVLATDLAILEILTATSALILHWNTKSPSLWDISKNQQLRSLEITDFSKLNDISDLSSARQIEILKLEGGIDKKLNIQTLKPLSVLTNLKYLRLANLKVVDDTLNPLADLKNLEELWLSNQFETKEYAWLSTRLPNTKCNMFQAINKVNITGVKNELVWDIMVTGRRKPFLLSTKDKTKIDKYINEFEKLKNDLA